MPEETAGLEATPVDAEVIEENALAARSNRQEADIQVTTAKRYPRSLARFKQKVMELATIDKETSQECWYALPRAGKVIEGPSIRFAEIVAAAYSNLRSESRHVSTGDSFVTCEGVCWDLENNVAVKAAVNRRILDRNGRRFNDDMIGTTIGAACSIALRNAVFRVVPKAIYKMALDEVRKVAMGDGRTITETRKAIIDHFGKLNVKPEQLLSLLGRKGIEDITLEDAATLRGLATAIKDGETTVAETFQVERAAPAVASVPRTAVKPSKAEHTKPGEAQTEHISDRLKRLRIGYKAAVAEKADNFADEIGEISWMEGMQEGVDRCEDPEAITKATARIKALGGA